MPRSLAVQGLAVLAALRKFAATSSTHLNEMGSQIGFVDKLHVCM